MFLKAICPSWHAEGIAPYLCFDATSPWNWTAHAWTRHRKLRNQTSSMTFAIPGNKINGPTYPMVKTPSKLAFTKCHCVFHLGTEQVTSHYLNHWWHGSQTCIEIDGCPVENDNGCIDRRWNTPCQHDAIHACRLANSMLQTLRCYTRKSIKQYSVACMTKLCRMYCDSDVLENAVHGTFKQKVSTCRWLSAKLK